MRPGRAAARAHARWTLGHLDHLFHCLRDRLPEADYYALTRYGSDPSWLTCQAPRFTEVVEDHSLGLGDQGRDRVEGSVGPASLTARIAVAMNWDQSPPP